MSRGGPHDLGSQLGDDTLQQDLDETFKVYDRRRHRLEDTADQNSTQRMELRHRIDNVEHHLDRLQESVGLLLEKPQAAHPDDSPKKPRARRKRLQSTASLDFKALKSQVLVLNLILEDLRESDRKHEEALESFDNAIQAMSTALRKRGLVTYDDAGPDIFLAPTPSAQSIGEVETSPPIPGELEAYYAAVSELRNMSERIGDLQVEKQEQEVRRGLEEDQGQRLDQTDDEFLRTWSKTLEVAFNDYETARTAALTARETCKREHVEIPPWARVNSEGDQADLKHDDALDQGMVSPPNSIPANSRVAKMDASEALLHDHGSPLATPPINNSLTTEMVSRWVESVHTPPPSVLYEIPVNWSSDVTDKDKHEVARTPYQRNDENAHSTRSAGAVTTTNTALDASTARLPSPSLGAEQSLQIDDELWDVAPSKIAP
jgi:hypothetical protein